MFNGFLPYNALIKNEYENVPVFSKFFVDNLHSLTKPNPRLRYECKILPFEESISGKELFKCPLCPIEKIEGRKSLTEHLHQHQLQYRPVDGRHLCCLCGKELSSNSSLERHLLTHSNHRPFDCLNCGKKFTTNGNLSRHNKTSHGSHATYLSNNVFCSKPTFEPNPPPLLFHNPLLSHFQLPFLAHFPLIYNKFSQSHFHPKPNSNILLDLFKNSLKTYKSTASPPNILEDVLNLSTKSESVTDVKDISEIYKGPVTNKRCSMLNKILAKKICRKYRERRINPVRRFIDRVKETCEIPLDLSVSKLPSPDSFQNSFLSNSTTNLMSSAMFNSTDETEVWSNLRCKKNSYKDAPKLIRCPMNGCAQKFPWNSSLMRHMLTHIAHKPFQCIRCSKNFSTKSNRERHMERVHGITTVSNRNKISFHGSLNENILSSLQNDNTDETSKLSSGRKFLSEEELIQMSFSDRRAEGIGHSLLKHAGDWL